ncbi:MAG: hypothetical protein Q8L52_01515 [bacterium]|nr:hypothetical protein [bacterium]
MNVVLLYLAAMMRRDAGCLSPQSLLALLTTSHDAYPYRGIKRRSRRKARLAAEKRRKRKKE